MGKINSYKVIWAKLLYGLFTILVISIGGGVAVACVESGYRTSLWKTVTSVLVKYFYFIMMIMAGVSFFILLVLVLAQIRRKYIVLCGGVFVYTLIILSILFLSYFFTDLIVFVLCLIILGITYIYVYKPFLKKKGISSWEKHIIVITFWLGCFTILVWYGDLLLPYFLEYEVYVGVSGGCEKLGY